MKLRLGHQLFDLSIPSIMGIINCTPDSFFQGSRVATLRSALDTAKKMQAEGVDFLDLGGMSTRPGAQEIDEAEEIRRIVPVIEEIKRQFPEIPLSIDTYRSRIAEKAVQAGADWVNDISAGNLDSRMLDCIADLQVPYILMHMQGKPKDMQMNPTYANILVEINSFFAHKVHELLKRNVNDLILDPGFGFGKSVDDNYVLLKNLSNIAFGEFPILVGLSRKSMIYKTLHLAPDQALNGTTALHMLALQNGASILRVHDVAAAREAITLHQKHTHVANI